MPATVQIRDLTPKFLKFYGLAKDADPETRWTLWDEHYGFAAVPPTAEGRQMARRMLDETFHRYPEVMDRIQAGAAGFRPEPKAALEAVCQLFAYDGDIDVLFVIFVGNFDGNAFAFTHNGVPVVNFAVEDTPEYREPVLAHEFAHVVHDRLSGADGGYIRSIAKQLMMEGIAIWTSQVLVPGRPDKDYIEFHPGWLEQCQANDQAILTGIRPFLADASEETLSQFIFGTGTTGLPRESYYAGWRAVGHLLRSGNTLAQLARLTEEQYAPIIDRTLAELTA